MSGKTRRQQLQEMLAEDPDDPFLRYGLAMDYAGSGEVAAAAGCFRELIRANPEYVPAYLQAAKVLQELGEQAEAREVARAGVAAARRAGDEHAAGELEFFLDALQ
jgi:cytochrome c-type biogenesis protein CcmH/NrfG